MRSVFSIYSYFFIILLLVAVSACSIPKEKEYVERETLFSVLVKPVWFTYRKDRALTDNEGNIVSHPFFDFNPFINFTNKSLNFFVLTPESSEVYFDFDLASGKRFRKHNLCSRKDVWGAYGNVSNPPYTEGLVPRTLDQLGTPQKIWVFGFDEIYERDPGEYAHRARVIGGVVQQYCPRGNCVGPREWDSRIILLAVNPRLKKFDSVNSVDDLKKVVDWGYVEAYANTAAGIKYRYGKANPGLRITGEVSAREALKYASIKSHNFDSKDMLSIQKSCHALYDVFYKNLNPKVKKKGFYDRFKALHRKYYKRIFTCMKYVRSSSINASPEQHWTMSYIEAFYNMHQLGHIYNCPSTVWVERASNTSRNFDVENYLNQCLDSNLDQAFEQAVFSLGKLNANNHPTYRYIEYDSLRGGSHNKLYSWVFNDGHSIKCPENEIKDATKLFPKDINWKSRLDIIEDENGYIR